MRSAFLFFSSTVMLWLVLGAGAQVRAGDADAGVYLASRYASVSRDFARANALYADLIGAHGSNETDAQLIERRLIYAIIAGERDPIDSLLDRLSERDPGNSTAQVVNIVRAVAKDDYVLAARQLELVEGWRYSDILLATLGGWIEAGRGNARRALSTVRGVPAEGPVAVMQDLHAALIADYSGWRKRADAQYRSAYASQSRQFETASAYVNFLLREGEVHRAERVMEELRDDHLYSESERIAWLFAQDHEKIQPSVYTIRQGVALVFLDLAQVLLSDKNYTLAAFYNQLSSIVEPVLQRARMQRGNIFFGLHRDSVIGVYSEEALQAYASVHPDSPYAAEAVLNTAMIYAGIGEEFLAEERYQDLIVDRPDDFHVLGAYSDFLREQKAYRRAADLLEAQIIKVESGRVGAQVSVPWDIYFRAGTAFERSKEWDRAELYLRRSLEVEPENPLVMNYLGYILVDQEQSLYQGLDLISRAVQLRPTEGYIVDSLGWAYYKLSHFWRATRVLETAFSLSPGDPEIQSHLGDAYYRVGREREAAFQWTQALDNLSDTSEFLREGLKERLDKGLAQLSEESSLTLPLPPPRRPR